MLGEKQIDGFKGNIDFYYYMGIACSRRWPKNQGKSQTPKSVAQQPMFTYVQKLWQEVSPVVQEAYNTLAPESALHKRDWFMRGYYGLLYRYPTEYTPA
ncbi:hypothetical protein ES703_117482 [subsurface metagenome]